jgi:hypothetical protein
MNNKIIIGISIAIVIVIAIITFSLTQNEFIQEEEQSRFSGTDEVSSILEKIKEDKIKNDESSNPYVPKQREWIQSGPFKIDRSEYVLGEKIFVNIDQLGKNTKGEMIFAHKTNSTHYYEYKKIKFDGSKPQQNFYLGFTLNPARGVCSSDMFVGDWEVVFAGTGFENLKFKVKDQIIPGMEGQYEPVC